MSNKKYKTSKTIVQIQLDDDIYKIGSAPVGVWEEFESLSEDHSPDKILNSSSLKFAQIAREFIKLVIKKHNKDVDLDKVHEQLSNLTIEDVLDLFNMATDIDKHLLLNLNSSDSKYVELTPEDQEKLKKK